MIRHVQITVSEELFDKTELIFQRGQRQAFLTECLENLIKLLEEGELPPPSEYSRRATIAAVENMTDTKIRT